MAEKIFLGNDWKVQLNFDSPDDFADACSVADFGSVGEEKPLVDVTTYCDNARAYRNGLADGVEIPLVMNYVSGDSIAKGLYTTYKEDTLVGVRIVSKDDPTEEYFEFLATVRAWNVTGPIGDKSSLTYTLKVSGEVLWVTPEEAP